MKPVEPSDYLSLLAIFVALVSAYAALRVDKKAIHLEAFHRVTDLFIKMDEVFIEYPEARPYFYEDKVLPSNETVQSQRVLMIAEFVLDVFDWVCHDCVGAGKEDVESWREFMASVFETSPVLTDFHSTHREWHPVLDQVLFSDRPEKLQQHGTRQGASPRIGETLLS